MPVLGGAKLNEVNCCDQSQVKTNIINLVYGGGGSLA